MKNAAETLMSGINATSAQTGRGRRGALISTLLPVLHGEGPGAGKSRVREPSVSSRKGPTPGPSPREPGGEREGRLFFQTSSSCRALADARHQQTKILGVGLFRLALAGDPS